MKFSISVFYDSLSTCFSFHVCLPAFTFHRLSFTDCHFGTVTFCLSTLTVMCVPQTVWSCREGNSRNGSLERTNQGKETGKGVGGPLEGSMCQRKAMGVT
jgi:hypothetical protein